MEERRNRRATDAPERSKPQRSITDPQRSPDDPQKSRRGSRRGATGAVEEPQSSRRGATEEP